MSCDQKAGSREIKRLEQERDWIPIGLAVGSLAIGYWRNEGFQTLTGIDAIVVSGLFGVLWGVLDIRVMLARHH